jgi:hypothetical protein
MIGAATRTSTDAVWMLQCYADRDPPARRATASAVEENASGS